MPSNPLSIIASKRDGGRLSAAELKSFISDYTEGAIPDYQMAALLMAIYCRGMDAEETSQLTRVMLESGERLDLSDVPGIKIDKHSTGGVGDKVSLVLAPLMAAAGIKVPMISGRGLGHTGGTLDKLESIPGFRTDLTPDEFKDQVRKIGAAIIGQTERLVPADKKIYALRDVTATVASIPLITASILSKKLAAGINGLVMDIKTGTGAFMSRLDQAEALAESILKTSTLNALPTITVITLMDQPTGYAAGNWLEVVEVVQTLQNHGPEDLMQVVIALGEQMLVLAEGEIHAEKSRARLRELIRNGAALKKFEQMVAAQGGDVHFLQDPGKFSMARFQQHLRSRQSGYVEEVNALAIGQVVVALGGGRQLMSDVVDPAAGVVLHKKVGDQVKHGELLAVLHTNRAQALKACLALTENAFRIGRTRVAPRDPVFKVLT
jgi:pyrimidine-nucleoside phosphorylase